MKYVVGFVSYFVQKLIQNNNLYTSIVHFLLFHMLSHRYFFTKSTWCPLNNVLFVMEVDNCIKCMDICNVHIKGNRSEGSNHKVSQRYGNRTKAEIISNHKRSMQQLLKEDVYHAYSELGKKRYNNRYSIHKA